MLGKTEMLDTNLIGQRCPCIHHSAFYPRISWPKRAQTVWPQWLYQPWPQLWIGPSSLTGPTVPVRAFRFHFEFLCLEEKTGQDLRQNKELVFVSFKKGCDKDISPATISSWIKQTVILCYELSDQEALTLRQVKAHDVGAFAASKAFQSGVSLEQILSACHWKSHNTFTQFYLKDVAWADSEIYHLGPVVAAHSADPPVTLGLRRYVYM